MADAATTYAAIVSAMTGLGYTQWRKTLSFREVPEASADGLFQVIPASTEPQIRLRGVTGGTYTIDTRRTWRVGVLFRVVDGTADFVEDDVLPAEEDVVEALLAISGAESVAVTYSDTDDAGGIVHMSLELTTRYDRSY